MRTTTAAFVCLTLLGGAVAASFGQTNDPLQPPRLPAMPRYQQVTDSVHLHELSPVAYFRVLLGMTAAERERALAEKPATEREAILGKVSEYEALPPAIREARLRQTQLRWTLVALMKVPPAQRAERLRGLVLTDQPWIKNRLREWDQLPTAEQKAYLEKQSFLSLYLRWQSASSVGQAEIINKLPPASRAQWMGELARWQALPEGSRQEMCNRFSEFFAMDDRQKQATVSALSDQERRQMENSLRAFAQLSAAKRRLCVQSFSTFATMKPDEQDQFLRNAAQWENMTPEERRLWRELVHSLPAQPPMPPGFRAIPPGGLPPMPPGFNSPPMPPAPKNIYAKSTTN
jgi:hypothetical protein